MPPLRLPALSSPVVVETEEEHSVPDAPAPAEAPAADAAAGAEAVVLGDCVVVLAVSPGNCSAVCGLNDDGAFVPLTDSDSVANPPVSGMVDVGKVNGSVVTVPVEPIWVDWVSWACAAVNAASHSIAAKMNVRLIVPSEIIGENAVRVTAFPGRYRLSVMERPATRADRSEKVWGVRS
jgi:hypothetical protein